MRFSIVIPTRNEAAVIGDALQHYAPFWEQLDLEIIVSDANSQDGTAEIVRHWMTKCPGRVQLVQAQGKQNIAIGRNYGAKFAQGQILFHTDADVRVPDPERFFSIVSDAFEQVTLAAVTAPIRVYNDLETGTDRFYHWLMNSTIRFSMLFRWCLAKGECQIVRRSAFEAIGGYDEQLVAGEDCNLFYRVQKAGNVRFLPHIEVRHSPRRFREYGYFKVSYHYLMEGLWRLFLGKSFAREWTAVR